MVFIYCRVSTPKQEDNYSYAAQRARGIAFAESINQPYEIYTESKSGTEKGLGKRLEWNRLISDLESKGKETDIIWYGNDKRLTRNMIDYKTIEKISRIKKIKLYEDKEKRYIDYSIRGERITGGIKALLAEEDADELNEKLFDGLKESWNAGKRVHTKIYGYDSSTFDSKSGKRIWTIVPEEKENILRAFELYEQGISLHKIAELMNNEGRRKRKNMPFDYQDVSRILKKPIYAGLTENANGELIKSELYEPIISIEQHKKVMEAYPTKTTIQKRGRNPLHLGSGMLFCPYCNSGFWVYQLRDKTYYKHNADIDCGGQKLFMYTGINMILSAAYIKAIQTKPQILKVGTPKEITQEIARYTNLIKVEENNIVKYKEAITTGKAVEFFANEIESSLHKIKVLKEDVEKIKAKYQEQLKLAEKLELDYAIDNIKKFENAKGVEKRNILKTIIDRVIVTVPEIQVITKDERTLTFSYEVTKKFVKALEKQLKGIKKMGDSMTKKEDLVAYDIIEEGFKEVRDKYDNLLKKNIKANL